MRFDTPIFFQRIQRGEYDPDTGNYGEDVTTEEVRYADVTDAGIETLKIVYGELKQGSKVIRLQNHYEEPFDRIRIGRKTYRVDYARDLRVKQVFVVSETTGALKQKEGVLNGKY